MKKLVFVSFGLLVSLASLTASELHNKLYLNENDLFFADGKIFLHTFSGPIQLDSISSDEKGVYASIQRNKWPWTPFICDQCHRANKAINFACEYCGAPRPD